MRIHAIQTGTVTLKALQPEGKGGARTRALRTILHRSWTEPLPILAWVVEHPDGPVVVDTGENAGVMEKGYFPAWHPYARLAMRLDVRPEQEIGPRMRALGLDPEDVRTVVLTHLHTDHVGGVGHFPRSEVVVTRTEWERAQGFAGKVRGYVPHRFPQAVAPRLVDLPRDPYGPFEASMEVADGIRLVATPGHTPGHISVVVEDGGRTLFLAGDLTYREDILRRGGFDGVTDDPRTSAETVAKVRSFVDERGAVYLPAHDPGARARLEASSAGAPQPPPAGPSAA